jgi:hypothetical protein
MAKKTFYTVVDIEELARHGVDTLQVHEDIYLTDLAREKAERLGIMLVAEHLTPASAPIRPYIGAQPRAQSAPAQPDSRDALYQQVRAEVERRLGDEFDPALLDTIIRRVLDGLGGIE